MKRQFIKMKLRFRWWLSGKGLKADTLYWPLMACVSWGLFKLCGRFAAAERGYEALGGEVVILGLPWYIKAIGSTVKDWLREITRDEGE